MQAIRVLWIDQRCHSSGNGLLSLVPEQHLTTRVVAVEAVLDSVHMAHPNVACVEFDYPDEARLSAVPAVRHAFPDLPLLMFTEYHSEALAVQAFRWGVWDYRVKPVSSEIMARSVEFAAQGSARLDGRGRNAAMPVELALPGRHLAAPVLTTVRTAAAVAHVASHYAEPVTRRAVAALCHLSLSEFSRAFRREHEVTFERHLLEFRIARARESLLDPRLTITQVAHAAGFNDASYFARAFKRIAGISASDWRQHATRTPPAAES